MKRVIIISLSVLCILLLIGCAAKKVQEPPKTATETPLDKDLTQIDSGLTDSTGDIDAGIDNAVQDLEIV